jgi:hypothetical protein
MLGSLNVPIRSLVRAAAGKLQNWLTPTISPSSPSAKSISVVDGASDTTRGGRPCADRDPPAGRIKDAASIRIMSELLFICRVYFITNGFIKKAVSRKL